jgi:hypothetical protein
MILITVHTVSQIVSPSILRSVIHFMSPYRKHFTVFGKSDVLILTLTRNLLCTKFLGSTWNWHIRSCQFCNGFAIIARQEVCDDNVFSTFHINLSHINTWWFMKVRVQLPLTITCRHTGGAQLQLHSFLTSGLDWGKWLMSHAGWFNSRVRTPPQYPLNRNVESAQTSSGHCGKNLLPLLGVKPQTVKPAD